MDPGMKPLNKIKLLVSFFVSIHGFASFFSMAAAHSVIWLDLNLIISLLMGMWVVSSFPFYKECCLNFLVQIYLCILWKWFHSTSSENAIAGPVSDFLF